MMDNYSSKVFTDEMTKTMMQAYLDDEINSDDPLFNALISEAISLEYVDEYLQKDMTLKVLNSIVE
jgi:hypothetical protein